MDAAARNPMEAARFIIEAENRHPNRHDICKEGTQGAPFGEFQVGRRPNATNPFGANTATANPFGGNTATMAPTTGAFGQPSALGQQPNPFGQPSQPAFGQPSQPSAFGQPSQTASPFSQPSQPASAFGQPSALGAKPSPFGAPAFGQPPQPNAQSSPFGQPQTQGNAFGQPSALGQKPNPFGSATGASPSPFGQPPAPAANPFATPAQNQNAASPFSQQKPVQTQSPFGAPANQPFAQNNASPFGQQPQQQQQQQPQPAANPFAQNQTNGASSQANPFGAAQQPPAAGAGVGSNNPYPPGSSKQHPNIDSYSSRSMDGRLTMFKGKPVTYMGELPGIRAFDGTWTRIWFPKGPPGYNKDTALPIEAYSDQLKNQWAAFAETGEFAGGLMPELPPPRECTQWDF